MFKKERQGGSKRDSLLFVIKVIGITILIAWLFYDSVFGLICALVVVPLLVSEYRKELVRKQLYQMEQQFHSGLVLAAGALEAGYSVENAWREIETELVRLYGAQGVFVKKVHQMNQKLGMNEPLEDLLWDVAENIDSDNIKSFAEVFYFARRSGGNMSQIMRQTANRIRESFAIQEEIQLALSARQMELLILYVMPLAILAYLRIGSAGFLAPLYHNWVGVLIMSGCLVLYGIAWWVSKKIVKIGVNG